MILQPYDVEVGAGTLHPATVLRALGPKPWNAAYVQPSRRPARRPLRREPEPAAALLPVPGDPEAEPAEPAGALPGLAGGDRHRPLLHDIRFVEDDWENPTVGAWGLGWEVWCDGMEITQYTYFQQVGGLDVYPVAGELTYGLERLAHVSAGHRQRLRPAVQRPRSPTARSSWQNEQQHSAFNSRSPTSTMLKRQFEDMEREVPRILAARGRQGQALVLPAYDHVLKASHLFNLWTPAARSPWPNARATSAASATSARCAPKPG